MITGVLLAYGFVNPAFLGGLGLVAAPIIIHLLSRRSYRRLDWAATHFLLQAEKQNRRRVRFEQWLLVALRCLALALLTLLVARPFVQPGIIASLLGARGVVQRIAVLDDSASLSYRVGPAAEFADLRDATVRLLNWLHQDAAGDPVTLYLTSRPQQPLVADKVLSDADLADLRAQLERLTPTPMPANPQRVFQHIAARLSAARSVPADIFVFSDFQRSEWIAGSAGAPAAFAALTESDASRARVILIASGVDPRDNLAIIDLSAPRPQTIAGVSAQVVARVVNYGRATRSALTLQVDVDGAPLPPIVVDPLSPGQERLVTGEATIADVGFHELRASIGAVDAFEWDNARLLSLNVKPAIALLLVNGQSTGGGRDDGAHLLQTALSPPGTIASGNQIEVVDPGDLDTADLRRFDVVLLCNVPAISEAAQAALRRFVSDGGGLAIFMGDAISDAAEFTRTLRADDAGLLPLPVVGMLRDVEPPTGVGLFRVGEHPVTTLLPALAAPAESPRFHGYFAAEEPVSLSRDSDSPTRPQVLARFSDRAQSPALVERRIGDGRVIWFASSVDLAWNNWAQAVDGSYVVWLLELTQHLARRELSPPTVNAGQRLTIQSAAEGAGGALFKSPAYPDRAAVDGAMRELERQASSRVAFDGPIADLLGAWRVELSTSAGVHTALISANLDPIKSDLAVAARGELDRALAGVPHEYVATVDAFLRGREQSRIELWPAVLVLVFATLLAEHALAWWFGTPRATRPAGRYGRPARAAWQSQTSG
ncbi:MAG: BatA domain-containing protein [Phycisphaerae bacterium]